MTRCHFPAFVETHGGLYNLHDMVHVRAPSRLHFGLLSLSREEKWPNLQGEQAVPSRHFGGADLMIEEPGIDLSVQPAVSWSAHGPLAERALAYAHRFGQTLPPEV